MKHRSSTFRTSGLALVELLVAALLAASILLGFVKLVTAAGSATRLQDNQAALHDQARYTQGLLADAIHQAGYSPTPWNRETDLAAIAPETADGSDGRNDRLAVQSWSDLNCFDNRNPDLDSAGQPRFYLRESVFDVNGSGHLARTCRYGPSRSELVSQVRRQGLVPGVESFQLLFGDDSNGDGNVDRWVRAGDWSGEVAVTGVRVGLLLAGPDAVLEPRTESFAVLDRSIDTGYDGKLRHVTEFTAALRGQVR